MSEETFIPNLCRLDIKTAAVVSFAQRIPVFRGITEILLTRSQSDGSPQKILLSLNIIPAFEQAERHPARRMPTLFAESFL